MEKSVKIFENIDELSAFLARQLIIQIQNIPEGRFFSIALSGGSTPRIVFQQLALKFRNQIDWKKIKVFWGDERCVAPKSDESNYNMAKESLFDHVPIPAGQIFRIKGEDNPVMESERYAKVVTQHIPIQNAVPQFDFIMLGLGEDGHTASIFPGRLDLFNTEKLFVVAEHPVTEQKRISASGRLINNARTVAFLVTGESKSMIISKIINQKGDWEKLPASLVRPKSGELIWLLDDKSGSRVKAQFDT